MAIVYSQKFIFPHHAPKQSNNMKILCEDHCQHNPYSAQVHGLFKSNLALYMHPLTKLNTQASLTHNELNMKQDISQKSA